MQRTNRFLSVMTAGVIHIVHHGICNAKGQKLFLPVSGCPLERSSFSPVLAAAVTTVDLGYKFSKSQPG